MIDSRRRRLVEVIYLFPSAAEAVMAEEVFGSIDVTSNGALLLVDSRKVLEEASVIGACGSEVSIRPLVFAGGFSAATVCSSLRMYG